MPKFEDIIRQEMGVAAEESSEEGEQETKSAAAPETFERITKKDAVSDEERDAFTEMQRRLKMDKSEWDDDPMLMEKIEAMIELLPDKKQREVVKRKYFNHERFEDIGKSLGVTGSWAQQIFSDALKHLESRVWKSI